MVKKVVFSEAERVRWQVAFDEGNWLLGIYRPEFGSREEVKELEKHDAPELFLLLEGRVVLLLQEEEEEVKELELRAGEAVILDCWHNAYSPDRSGQALVVERTGVRTEFKPLA